MRIKRCYIENFGCLEKKSYDFSDGATCILSENGTGKSTLGAFVAAMLYGLGDTRKVALAENDRKKYFPWNGGACAGSLTIECGGKEYIIERKFGQKAADDTFRLIDGHTGLISTDFSENIGEELLSIDRDGFLRTTYLSEKALSAKNDNKTISAKLSDLVGADGDVGEFDRAVEAIEQERKILHKKGGSGLISDLKSALNARQRELDRLESLDGELTDCRARLETIHKECAECESKKDAIKARQAKIGELSAKEAQEEKYVSLCAEYEKEKAAFEVLRTFFKNGVPSLSDIDRARDDSREYRRLSLELQREDLSDSDTDKTYESLKQADIFEAEAQAGLLRELEGNLSEFDGKSDAYTKRLEAIFPSGAPSSEEIKSLDKSRAKGTNPALITAGIVFALAGVLLGAFVTPYCYLICAIGTIFTAIYVPLSLVKGDNGATKLAARYGIYSKSRSEATEKLTNAIREYESIKAERGEKEAEIKAKCDALRASLSEFISRFGLGLLAPAEAIGHIRESYAVWQHKKSLIENGKEARLKKAELAKALKAAADAFSDKYPTVSESPFEEIREAANEYDKKRDLLNRLAREIEDYKARYGVGGAGLDRLAIEKESRELCEELKRLDAHAKTLVSERALLERRDAEICAELEKTDELKAEIGRLCEEIAEKESRLTLLKKTREYLEKACNNMTARYLGKTRERFLEYERRISGGGSEFSIDTSFTPSRAESGIFRSEDSFSRGTRDLYALAIRLALIDSLYENEQPFIILDDPFIAFDDKKCKKGIDLIRELERDRQIIYLTCSSSRAF